jgi:uncharacterized membrane protein
MDLTEAAVLIVFFLCCMAVAIQALVTIRVKFTAQPKEAEAILAERFANGEIDEAEYSDRLSSLRMGPPLQIK